MHKIAVMGDRDSIYGFAALGMEPFPITDPTEAAKKLHQIAEENYAVVYMTEALGSNLQKELDRQLYRLLGLISYLEETINL